MKYNLVFIKMTSYTEENLHLLQTLHGANPTLRAAILKNANDDLILSLCEVCHNYTSGNVNCSNRHFNEISKYQNDIRKIAKGKNPKERERDRKKREAYEREIRTKRSLLLQQGSGFWSAVLSPLMTDLGTLFLNKFVGECIETQSSGKKSKKRRAEDKVEKLEEEEEEEDNIQEENGEIEEEGTEGTIKNKKKKRRKETKKSKIVNDGCKDV